MCVCVCVCVCARFCVRDSLMCRCLCLCVLRFAMPALLILSNCLRKSLGDSRHIIYIFNTPHTDVTPGVFVNDAPSFFRSSLSSSLFSSSLPLFLSCSLCVRLCCCCCCCACRRCHFCRTIGALCNVCDDITIIARSGIHTSVSEREKERERKARHTKRGTSQRDRSETQREERGTKRERSDAQRERNETEGRY